MNKQFKENLISRNSDKHTRYNLQPDTELYYNLVLAKRSQSTMITNMMLNIKDGYSLTEIMFNIIDGYSLRNIV